MNRKVWLHTITFLLGLAFLTACALPAGTLTPIATVSSSTETPPASPTTPVVVTATASATTSPAESTATPGTAPTSAPTNTHPVEAGYLDDRSSAASLMRSYFNAINRKEYLRAYSYWRDPQTGTGSYDNFAAGYAATKSVALILGTIGGDAGAGQIYYSVPALLTAQTNDGQTQAYAACYILHLSQPAIQEPPFQGLSIERGRANPLPAGANEQDALAAACSGPDYPPGQPLSPTAIPTPNDISQAVYLDNRSDPAALISSLFNAINHKEYARAYGYWDNQGASAQVAPYEDFKAGYANTASVELLTGQATSDAGAGQLYYSLPVVVTATQTDGSTQVFSGCYTLHLSNPTIQATPPFHPLAIQSGVLTPVQGSVDTQALLANACQP